MFQSYFDTPSTRGFPVNSQWLAEELGEISREFGQVATYSVRLSLFGLPPPLGGPTNKH